MQNPALPSAEASFLQGVFPGDDVSGKLVDGHDFVELRAFEGDELHVRIFVEAAGGENTVAQYEKTFLIHPVVRGDALHRLLDAGNFRTVFQQDMSRFRGYGECFGVAFLQQFFRTL